MIKIHTKLGAEVMATIPGEDRMVEAVRHHHEALDGSGYPDGLRGEDIPLWARIIHLADAYVNLTTDHHFTSARTSEQALNEVEGLSGLRFDGLLVRLLIRQLKAEKASRLDS